MSEGVPPTNERADAPDAAVDEPQAQETAEETSPDGGGEGALEQEGDIAADYLEELLDIADLDGDLDMDVEGDRAAVSIVGADLNQLVGADGAVLDPSGISLTDSATYDSQPAVAPRAGGAWMLVYRRFAWEKAYGADRLFQLTVAPG